MFKLSRSPNKLRIFGAAPLESFFANPELSNTGNALNYELGLRFRPAVNGLILGIRYWKAPNENIVHVGRVWNDSGTQLASVTFTSETNSGWQQQYLATPLVVTANTFYRVSVNCLNGFAHTPQGFAASLTKGNLFAPVNAGSYANGAGNFPNLTFNNNNYYRDVIFIAS